MKFKPHITHWILATLLTSGAALADLVPITDDIASGTSATWYATNAYRLDTVIYVQSNAVLTIEPGTVVYGSTNVTTGRTGIPNLVSALWVTRGGKLMAEGTKDAPIIFTAEGDDLQGNIPPTQTALWGGVVLLGNAVINSAKDADGNAADPKYDVYEGTTEAGPYNEHVFGGTNDVDSSGVLRYVSIRHAGNEFAPASELNGLTVGAVGSGTVLEYVEVFAGSDDGFEWWGGTVNANHLVAAFCEDDDFDTDQGYRGTLQFILGIKPPWAGTSDSRGFESDGDLNQSATGELPIGQWSAYNATLIGRGKGEASGSLGVGWNARDESAPNVFNSVFSDFNQGLLLDSDGLFHFTNSPALAFVENNIWDVNTNANAAGEFVFTTAEFSNTVQSAMLGGISYTNDLGLDPRPQGGSPVYIDVRDGAPVATSYRGAFSGATDDWADGWTALSSLGYLKPATTQTGESFSDWAIRNNLPVGQDGATADADTDGVLNAVEFALGSNPLGENADRLPAGTTVNVQGQDYPAVTFTRNKSALGVTLEVDASGDLSFETALDLVVESVVDLGDGTERVTVRTANPLNGAVFFRTRAVTE